MTVTRVFVFTSGGPTYVTEQRTRDEVVGDVNAGILFDFPDISGTTFSVNPNNVVAVMEREDPQ